MKLRRKIAWSLLALGLLAPTTAVYLVASTQAGLRFVAHRLGKIGPVTITVGEVEGSLTGGFHVSSVRVEHRLSDVRVEDLSGRIELLPLLALQRIELPEFHVSRASIRLKRSDDDRARRKPRFMPPTMRLDATNARVDSVELFLSNGRRLEGTDAWGEVTILQDQIRIRTAQIDSYDARITAAGRVLAEQPVGLDGEVGVVWRIPGQPEWQFSSRFEGNLDSLPLTVEIRAPFHATARGEATTLNSGWKFAGNGEVADLDISVFGGGTALGIISAQLDITANADGFGATGKATPPGLNAGAFDVDFAGSYSEKRLTIQHAIARHPGSGARATARGTVDVVPQGPELALSGEWTEFRWPLAAEEPAFTSQRGTYSIRGRKPWAVSGEAIVSAAGQNDMPATLEGSLAPDALTIQNATVQLLGGNATVTGEARWKPGETWQVKGRMEGMDAAQLREDLPGRLSFDFDASGAPFGGAGAIDFALAKMTGRLRNQAASGSGRFTKPENSDDWHFDGVDLRLGRTRLQLDGSLGAERDLTFAIDADDLSLFDPEARGRVSARGRYAGTPEAPLLLFKARGTDFAWQQYQLKNLDADVDLDLGPGKRARGKLEITDLAVGSRTIGHAIVNLTGDDARQMVTLDVDAAPLRAAISLNGAMQQGLWRGEVSSMLLRDNANLALQLESPAAVALALDQVALAQTCLKGMEARFCASADRVPDGAWSTEFLTEALPLDALTAGLTQNMHYDGTINLHGELRGAPGSVATGFVRSELSDAKLRHMLGNGREEVIELGSGSVVASATPDAFVLDVNLDAGEAGGIHGEINGSRSTPEWTDYPIRGTLDARTVSLSLLDIYIGEIDKATGRLTIRAAVSGTLGKPELQGELELREAAIDSYQFNVALRDLSLDARFDNTALDFSGRSRLGNEAADFSGRLAWQDGEPYGNLKVKGDRLLVVNIPEARILASPNLDFKLAGRRVDVSGEVRIPEAKLEPADLTNAVLTSGDERLTDAPPPDPARRWTVVTNIGVVLGDKVNIQWLGLTARLGGRISLRTDELQRSRAQGELNIAEGKYEALGRLLDIERGRLIFNNGLVDDPGVDLRAQKVFPEVTAGTVTAGINVRGKLRDPVFTFFSEPAIPQSQIASLILAGGSIETLQDNQKPGAARNDLLAQGGAILAQRFGSRVGIDDVGIESDTRNETSLVVGKYISDRLYVSYGISLAEAINTLKLRYTIGDRWTIKTEAGKERSADIVYTFKKK